MSSGEGQSEPVRAGRRTLGARFGGLPSRIIVAVFSAALVTGMAVTFISTRSTEQFLREKIDDRFPDLLEARARGLEAWYSQRELDIATFASSATVVRGLEPGDAASRRELSRYLAYVQERFPQYGSLLVLDTGGGVQVEVSPQPSLGEAHRRMLAQVESNGVSGVLTLGGEPFQVISSAIERNGRRVGSLHAVIRVEALRDLLMLGDGVEASVGLYLVGEDATVVAASPGARPRTHYERPLPAQGAAVVVEDYATPGGDHVVGTAMRVGGWVLAVEQDYQQAFAPVVSMVREVLALNIAIVLLFGVLASVIARSIVRPIQDLSDRAMQIAQGDPNVEIVPSERGDEIGVLSRALHEMLGRLTRNRRELMENKEEIERAYAELTRTNEELHRNNEILEQLSFTDGLTRLHNHRYFQDRLRIEAKRADRNGEPLALLLLDIDDFKALNDRYGHVAGDEVLRRVGAVLNAEVRDTDLPARYGGEEFAVLAPRTALEGAIILGEKLREGLDALRVSCSAEGEQAVDLRITVSIGVSVYHGDTRRLFVEADRALYRAKDRGKDCVVFYETDPG